MKSFVFPLQKVLEWRRAQLGVEEDRLRRLAAGLAALERERAELEHAGRQAEFDVRGSAGLTGSDLAALSRYQRYAGVKQKALAAGRAEWTRKMAVQQGALVAARRRLKLLERLREQKLAVWTLESQRETESIAAESYLARWPRRKKAGEPASQPALK